MYIFTEWVKVDLEFKCSKEYTFYVGLHADFGKTE